MSNSDIGENDNNVVQENHGPPRQPKPKELDEAVNAILIVEIYNFEEGLKMRTLALKCKNVFMKARIQKMNERSLLEYCLNM